MVKNILAFFGLLFLCLVILVGVGSLGLFYDSVDLLAIPKQILAQVWPEDWALVSDAVTVSAVDGIGQPQEAAFPAGVMMEAEWSNPLDLLPAASPTPMPTATPLPTATPIPPLDPLVYRTETLIRLKEFVRALEGWLAVNDRAALEPGLVEDAGWQGEMTSALRAVVEKSHALAAVGPAPSEYSALDALFDSILHESEQMQWNIEQGLANRDPALWTAAGEGFARIKEYLAQAAGAMLEAGWSLES